MLNNEVILIIGGTGSLGNALVDRYLCNNRIILFSRDESKQWLMKRKYNNNSNMEFVIGDIRDKYKVIQTIRNFQPTVIIIAAAMKHIDRCEFEIHESISTNTLGPKNVLDGIEESNITSVKRVCFISTDKACSPVNVYGLCKALSESLVIEKAKVNKATKYVVVRYGNVLNSRGSIIPLLQEIGNDPKQSEFLLTNEVMTRFMMTLTSSIDLIDYALCEASSGDIVIPYLPAFKIKDLFTLFSAKYQKPIKLTGIRPGEKLHEALVNETQSSRTYKAANNKYLHIKPIFACSGESMNENLFEYNSNQNLCTIEELEEILNKNNLL